MIIAHAFKELDKKTLFLKDGYAVDIQTLWRDVIKPTLPSKDRVLAIYKCLLQYIVDPEAVFVIRNGNTRVKGDPKTLRRGFLTEFTNDKRCYLYTDNDFATIMFKLIYDDAWDIDYDQFKDAMLNRAFPVHFNASCEEERDKAAYPITQTPDYKKPSVGDGGYKVSHIFDVGTEYKVDTNKVFGLTDILNREYKDYLCLGEYDNWTNSAGKGYYARTLNGPLPDEVVDFLKAHFLRLACPMNYILTPKKDCQILGRKVSKNDIGEHKRLIEYAQVQLRKYYGPEYDEYKDMLMLPDDDYIGLAYGRKSSGNQTGTTTPKSGSSGVRKITADEFSEFKAFVGTSSADGYCTSVRAIMKEMGINTAVDFEQCIDSAIDYCTQRKIAAITDKEKKRYSDRRSHLRQYKKYLESRKLHP